jgi:hypothetical protein
MKSVGDDATMTPRSIREYAEAIRPRYVAARKVEKGQILTEFCRVTGYHRDSAIRLLRHVRCGSGKRRGRPRTYGPAVAVALKKLWETANRICSKNLEGLIPVLVKAMEAHGEIELSPDVKGQLLGLKSATIDRLLKPYRRSMGRKPPVQSRSSSAIKALVPVRTFGEWEGLRPGSFQVDLVAHCGESTGGFYLNSLVAVDVATGWNDCRAVWGRHKDRVGGAIHRMLKGLPFPMVEMHTDNGGEFLNDVLYPWCKQHGIRFTRGRAYKKNDQAHVEQKNWSSVRRFVGYDRYATRAAYQELEKLYDSLRLYINFFQPIRKLVAKERVGSKVIKRYDAARTPYQRLLESGVLEEEQKQRLEQTFQRLNPVKLKAEIDATLERLWRLAVLPREGILPANQPGADAQERRAFGSSPIPSASRRTGQG